MPMREKLKAFEDEQAQKKGEEKNPKKAKAEDSKGGKNYAPYSFEDGSLSSILNCFS